MLDTHARKFVQPSIEKTANIFIKLGFTANKITIFAFLIGVVSAICIYFGYYIIGVFLLWLSGFFDALDGTIARLTKTSSPVGTLLDIVFDRVVEIAVLLALLFSNISDPTAISLVFASIILSMTVFLTVGATATNHTAKSFHYQTGLAERTEAFIMLTLAILIHDYNTIVLLIFALIVFYTAITRFIEGIKMLSE